MKILLVIIGILSTVYVGGMMWLLCYIAGEADEVDEEIWRKERGEHGMEQECEEWEQR